jgi:glycerol dehydrogenase-like iron-containing ADH family enzyme
VLRDNRRAVIDAATAAEVALAHALRTRLGEMPEDALEATIRSVNGLVGLLKLVEQIDSTEKSRWKRVADRLANPRNSCVHRGIKLTREEVQSAIEEAHTLLETYSPLPKLT